MLETISSTWCVIVFTIFATSLTANVSGNFKLTILHNNDMHSHLEETSQTSGRCTEPGRCYGGFARISSTVEQIRRNATGDRHVLFMNAGDTFQGTPYYSLFKWKVLSQFIDHLGLDVMCLGNHEFDDGPQGLAPFLERITTTTVSCNINVTLEPSLNPSYLRPSMIKDFNGTKVGIIGYLTPDTKYMHKTGQVIFYDEIPSINRESARLKGQGVNIIIALGHSGYLADLKIAESCPDVDVVVGGHTNTFLYTGNPPDIEKPIDVYPKIVTQQSGKKVAVVQAFAYTKYLGYLMVDFDNKGEPTSFSGNPILLDSSYPEDSKILAKLEPFKQQIKNRTSSVVGETKVFLRRDCKLGECNIGNLITDAMLHHNVKKFEGIGWTDAPIALIQGGGIRGSINASANNGNITYGDILEVLPFENVLMKIQVKGNILKQILEFAVHRYEKTRVEQVGEFLSVAGIKVVYNVTQPAYNRVVSVKVLCANCSVPFYEQLNENAVYGIILADYLVDGGDKYDVIKNNTLSKKYLDITDVMALRNYIESMTPIYPGLEGRITIHSTNQSEPTGSSAVSLKLSTIILTIVFVYHLI